MANFIELKNTYNPLTTQGEGYKLINIDQIVHITDWSANLTNNRIKTIKTRITFSTGEIIDTPTTLKEIEKKIKDCEEVSK